MEMFKEYLSVGFQRIILLIVDFLRVFFIN